MTFNVHRVILRLALSDEGQDLVEYALLTAAVGLAGVAAFGLMRDNMGTSYRNWTELGRPGSIQENWIPAPPGS